MLKSNKYNFISREEVIKKKDQKYDFTPTLERKEINESRTRNQKHRNLIKK
jgi:hypothetical protein